MESFLIRRSAQRLSQSPSSCPPADLLAAALEERLSGAEAQTVSTHLRTCEMCAVVARDFASLREIAASCPSVVELLRVATGTPSPLVEAHAAICAGCASLLTYGRANTDEARAMVELLDAQSTARALGIAVAATAVMSALLSRRAALSAAAQGRVHRSREGSLGVSAARPRHLTWSPFGRHEDTYEVVLETAHGEARLRTHDTSIEIDAETWARLQVSSDTPYRWSVTALLRGKPCETQEGAVSFLPDDALNTLQKQEGEARKLGADRAILALSCVYRSWRLNWEACDVLNAYVARHPSRAVGHLLLGEVCEEMERVQEAARAIGLANRLMSAA